MEQFYIHNLWKIYANVNNIDSSSHSFLGHNLHPQTMGFMHTFRLSFFPFKLFSFNFLHLKGINCTPKLCKKSIGHCAHSRAKDHHTSLLCSWIGKQCCDLST